MKSKLAFRPGIKPDSFKSYLELEGMDEDFSPFTSPDTPEGKRQTVYMEALLNVTFQMLLLTFNRGKSFSPLEEWHFRKSHPS